MVSLATQAMSVALKISLPILLVGLVVGVPLAVALPRMLASIEVKLATTGPTEKQRLRERAELVRGLLVVTPPGPVST